MSAIRYTQEFKREQKISKAVAIYQATPAGMGMRNRAFFRLAVSLKHCG